MYLIKVTDFEISFSEHFVHDYQIPDSLTHTSLADAPSSTEGVEYFNLSQKLSFTDLPASIPDTFHSHMRNMYLHKISRGIESPPFDSHDVNAKFYVKVLLRLCEYHA